MTLRSASVLEVAALTVQSDGASHPLPILEDVSFFVRPGEVLGLVGESAAGKSMAGAAIIGLLPPNVRIAAGSVRLDGIEIEKLSAEDMRRIRGRRIGMIFQDPMTSLNPLYTVGQQLVETIRVHLPLTPKQAWAKAVALLGEVGISDPQTKMRHFPHQFSGGMRQRVVIALAICADPEVIIADEPTTALDVSVQAQVLSLLNRLRRDHGAAVILITHDMGVIAQIADRVAVMYAGRIVEMGPVEDVLVAPHHPYSAGLMASIPRLGMRQRRLAQIKGAMPSLLDRNVRGCAFRARCERAIDRCASESPPIETANGSEVACWVAGQAARVTT